MGDLTHDGLRFPGLAAEIVQVAVVVARLIVVMVVVAGKVLIEPCVEGFAGRPTAR